MDILKIVVEIIGEYVPSHSGVIDENTNIRTELGINSLELMNVVVALEDRFDLEIADEKLRTLQTVGDIVEVLENCEFRMSPAQKL